MALLFVEACWWRTSVLLWMYGHVVRRCAVRAYGIALVCLCCFMSLLPSSPNVCLLCHCLLGLAAHYCRICAYHSPTAMLRHLIARRGIDRAHKHLSRADTLIARRDIHRAQAHLSRADTFTSRRCVLLSVFTLAPMIAWWWLWCSCTTCLVPISNALWSHSMSR